MERFFDRTKHNNKILFNLLTIAWGSCLLAASGALSIPLPFSPIPIALNVTMAVLLGVMLGPKRGVAAVLLWLSEAAIGLPVLSGGMGGILAFLGPKGGYLLGYPLAALTSGLIGYRKTSSLRLALAFLVGSLAVYPTGLAHLAHFVGWGRVIALGFLPFLAGDFIKSLVLVTVWKRVACRFISHAVKPGH